MTSWRDFMRTDEAVRELGMSRRSFAALVSGGVIRSYARPGDRWR